MSGLWGAIAAGADSASGMLGQQIKADAEARARNQQADIEERLQAAKEMRMEMAQQRAAEYKQGQATMRAGNIDADAKGILADERAKKIIAGTNGQTAAEFDAEGGSLPQERAAYEPNEVDKARARVSAAEKRGYRDEMLEGRGMLNAERQFTADEAKNARAAADLAYKEARDAAKTAADLKKAEMQHDKDMARISAMIGGKDKNIQAVDADGNLRAPTAAQLNAPASKYKPVSSIETERKTAASDASAEAKTAAQVAKEIAKLQDLMGTLPSTAAAKKRPNYNEDTLTQEKVQAQIKSLQAVKNDKQGIKGAPTPTTAGPWSKYGSSK